MKQEYRFFEVVELVTALDTTDIADDIAEIEEDMLLVISGWYVNIPSLNLNLHEGLVCIWNNERGLFMPDFAVTVVCEGDYESRLFRTEEPISNQLYEGNDTFIPVDYLYYGQGGFVSTLETWLNGRMSVEQIEQLWCELIIPE